MSAAFAVKSTSATAACVIGRIDVTNAAQALAEGKQAHAKGITDLDLQQLSSADSVTLAVLLAWSAAASRSQKPLVYRGMPDRLRAIARLGDAGELLGLDAKPAAQGRNA